jgi:uncharacterized protein YukE
MWSTWPAWKRKNVGEPPELQHNSCIMAQAIVDPEQLRQFAMQLKRFSSLLADSTGKLSQQMQQLAISWRDQEHVKFAAEFEQEMKQLARLIEASERHVPYLVRKAELIEEYQRGHG